MGRFESARSVLNLAHGKIACRSQQDVFQLKLTNNDYLRSCYS